MSQFYMVYFGSLLSLFFGVLFIAIGLPLKYRKIKRNNLYGFKVKYTLEDDEIWYEVNELLGRHMFLQGLAMLILGVVSLFLARGETPQVVVMVVAFVILIAGVSYSLVKGIKLMNEMAISKGLKK